jgi:hypothetical protein
MATPSAGGSVTAECRFFTNALALMPAQKKLSSDACDALHGSGI